MEPITDSLLCGSASVKRSATVKPVVPAPAMTKSYVECSCGTSRFTEADGTACAGVGKATQIQASKSNMSNLLACNAILKRFRDKAPSYRPKINVSRFRIITSKVSHSTAMDCVVSTAAPCYGGAPHLERCWRSNFPCILAQLHITPY